MGNNRKDLTGPMLIKRGRRLCKLQREVSSVNDKETKGKRLGSYSSTGIRHIIHNDSSLILNITDQHHPADDVRTWTLLVDQSKCSLKTISNRCRTLRASSIR